MTNTIMAIVVALILVEDSGPTKRGACGGVGVLQITEIMYREYARLGGTLPPEARENPMLSKQIAFAVINERIRRSGTTEAEAVKYVAWLWNPGDAGYNDRLRRKMR